MQEFIQAGEVFYAANLIVWQGNVGSTLSFQLAPATNTQGYMPGQLLAYVTSGQYAGQMINYDPAGVVPGQTTCVSVLIDPDLQVTIPPATVTPATFKVALARGKWMLNGNFLYATAINLSDVATGMAQLGAFEYFPWYNGVQVPIFTI